MWPARLAWEGYPNGEALVAVATGCLRIPAAAALQRLFSPLRWPKLELGCILDAGYLCGVLNGALLHSGDSIILHRPVSLVCIVIVL